MTNFLLFKTQKNKPTCQFQLTLDLIRFIYYYLYISVQMNKTIIHRETSMTPWVLSASDFELWCTKRFRKKRIHLIKWPSQSPNLKETENLWQNFEKNNFLKLPHRSSNATKWSQKKLFQQRNHLLSSPATHLDSVCLNSAQAFTASSYSGKIFLRMLQIGLITRKLLYLKIPS